MVTSPPVRFRRPAQIEWQRTRYDVETLLFSGSGVTLLDNSFAELSARKELPEFDIIAIHGIWTWISDRNREIVVDIIRRKLKVGGILYISYNCFLGWAVGIPLRNLMKLHVERAVTQPTAIASRIDNALAFAKQVADAGAAYFKANPSAVERLAKISEQNRNYLAHEYFNDDWTIRVFPKWQLGWIAPSSALRCPPIC